MKAVKTPKATKKPLTHVAPVAAPVAIAPIMGGTITLPADLFARYKKLSAEGASIQRELANVQKEMESHGLPVAKDIGQTAEYIIVNGNGDEMGKVTVFHFPGCVMPEGFRRRIS